VSDAWIQQIEGSLAWSEFYDPETVETWARDVRHCMQGSASGASPKEWSLTGPNIVVECTDLEDGAALLARASMEAGLKFARIPATAVADLVDDLRAPLIAYAPVLVLLDWGLWSFGSDPDSVAFAVKLRRQLQRFDATTPVLFAVCASSADDLCSDYLKIGAFDRVLAVQDPTPEFVGKRFLRMLDEGIADDSLKAAPAKTGLVLLTTFEDREAQQLAALRLQRLARRECRTVGLADLTELTIRGTQECSSLRKRPPADVARKRTAYHEAGHACIAVIASGGSNVPDYASIVPAKDFEGIVRESLAYHDAQDDFTFENLLLRVRTLLAGRAAEELGFGPRQVSSGANSDLAAATRLSYRHFAHSGFHSGMESGENSAAFLAVLPRGDKADPLQAGRVHREVRTFLANQYDYAMRTLTENRLFVDAVAERLLWDPVIDQGEMTEIAQQHGLMT
jgi:cell division protease FtsH